MKLIEIKPKIGITLKPDKNGRYFVQKNIANRLISYGLAERVSKKGK